MKPKIFIKNNYKKNILNDVSIINKTPFPTTLSNKNKNKNKNKNIIKPKNHIIRKKIINKKLGLNKIKRINNNIIHKTIEQKNSILKPIFSLKTNYNSIIPLNIFQTWFSKDLPPHMNQCVELLKLQNPEFTHHLFDDTDCRKFIHEHFPQNVLKAYDKLIPGAYKADLWRYCVLYIHGGIYLDIKFRCVNGFKLIALTEEEHFVNDCGKAKNKNIPKQQILQKGIFNALIVSLPNNPLLKKAIDIIVLNVEHRFYGSNSLSPTGPFLLKNIFTLQDRDKIQLTFYGYNKIPRGIHWNNFKILDIYQNYRLEQKKYSKKKHYSVLWKNRNIYNK